MNNLWKELNRPIKVLAPMAGYTDAAFRLICREYGADVVITELISADAIAHAASYFKIQKLKIQVNDLSYVLNKVTSTKNQPTADLLAFFEAERRLVVQLFGKNPANFAKAAAWVTKELKPDGIDINMGCPARKVVGSDHGAALIKYPKLAAEIVRAVKENTDLPVSVKTRLGWDNPDQILEFAPVLCSAGIDAIIIHGRTYKQGFKGEADWDNIQKVKEMLPNLIVIGNGGIKAPFITLIPNTKSVIRNLDGFAIGQATFGKPWIFGKNELSSPEIKDTIIKHAKIALALKGDFGLIEFRKHLLKYLTHFPGTKPLRIEATRIENIADIEAIVSRLC